MTQLQPLREAVYSVAESAAAYLPNLLTAVVMLAAGWLLSRMLAATAGKLLRRLRLDQLLEKAGWTEALAGAKIETSPSKIISRLVFWIVFVVFLVLAVENLGLGLTALPLRSFIAYLPRLLGAVLLLFVGLTLAMLLGNAVGTSLAKIHFEQHRLLANAARGLVLLVTFMAMFENLGFDVAFLTRTVTNLLTLFAAGLVITFALGSREAARNILSGYYARERFQAGDRLQLPEGEGCLEEIGTLTSEIRLAEGSLVVPNSRLVETAVHRIEQGTGGADG